MCFYYFFFFSSRRRHTRYWRDWSSDVCSSDLAAPDRPDRVHDPAMRQVPRARGLGVARRAAAERLALREDARARGAMDGPVDAAAPEEARVGGVDDHVGRLARDVALDERDAVDAPHSARSGIRTRKPFRAALFESP